MPFRIIPPTLSWFWTIVGMLAAVLLFALVMGLMFGWHGFSYGFLAGVLISIGIVVDYEKEQ